MTRLMSSSLSLKVSKIRSLFTVVGISHLPCAVPTWWQDGGQDGARRGARSAAGFAAKQRRDHLLRRTTHVPGVVEERAAGAVGRDDRAVAAPCLVVPGARDATHLHDPAHDGEVLAGVDARTDGEEMSDLERDEVGLAHTGWCPADELCGAIHGVLEPLQHRRGTEGAIGSELEASHRLRPRE